ncbi:ShlB/FhaC/HecB family hemolysin secretion/activation protein (plasmid) [Providencia rettgeri]|uniref:ShlB/FhaC/HecB family hemolysin secretion/activation protein n=1 Tax=Providencia rettgeri TaxID=587 RepID=UPI001C22531F|nr:ShlB/FhaC/HecB family hemolysin secretion/activation protein [Providencia rettgeri]QXB07859.1 ShlB/FhaC/HecB family hemolysin secretion/activation protein [Providencia rettgeri]
MKKHKTRRKCGLISLFGSSLFCVMASPVAFAVVSGDELFQRQTQQQDALQQQFEAKAPDVRLQHPVDKSDSAQFPVESPCFDITRVEVGGAEAFPRWVPLQRLADKAQGQCLGVQGINQLMGQLQNRLVLHGWVTARVLAPEQDLTTGTLKLRVIPGKVYQVRFADGSNTHATLFTAMPAHAGNLLDLRDIEQGLENLQRLPTVQASMDIEPSEAPGESDIVITRQQSKPWRVNAWVDNTGTDDTGKNQAGLMLAWDNPTTLSDLLYVTVSQDTLFSKDKGSTNYSGHYSVPFGYWQLAFTGSHYEYKQTIAGLNSDIEYTGKSESLNAQLSRLLFRNDVAKTTLNYGVTVKETRNFVNNTEIGTQKRRTSSWKLGLDHRQYLGSVVWDSNLSYQRGTRWFGAMPAFEEYRAVGSEDYATALAKIVTFSTSVTTPFTLGEQQFQHRIEYNRQLSSTPLTPQDQFSIGGRWTVRGFDGERTLSADSGWTVKNTLTWQTPIPQQALYIGADYGHVSGHNADWRIGNHLAGGAIGLQGALPWNISYDLSVGTPFSKPDGFQTDNATFAFSLNWAY